MSTRFRFFRQHSPPAGTCGELIFRHCSCVACSAARRRAPGCFAVNALAVVSYRYVLGKDGYVSNT